jgi:hypothetical protein
VNAAVDKWFTTLSLEDSCGPGWSNRWFAVTWKKQPYAQLEVKQTYANVESTSRCRIVDTEHAKVLNLFDYVKS